MKISLRLKNFETWAAFILNSYEDCDFNFDYQSSILYFGGEYGREKAKVLARRMKLEKIK
jgi:hypothetical protein